MSIQLTKKQLEEIKKKHKHYIEYLERKKREAERLWEEAVSATPGKEPTEGPWVLYAPTDENDNMVSHMVVDTDPVSDYKKTISDLKKTKDEATKKVNEAEEELESILNLLQDIKDYGDTKASMIDDINKVTNIQSFKRYKRVRFVYRDEINDGKPVPVEDSYVLFWQYSKNDPSAITKLDSSLNKKHIMHNIGIGRTDSNGYIYTSQPFYELFTWGLFYDESKGNLLISGDHSEIPRQEGFQISKGKIKKEKNLLRGAMLQLSEVLSEYSPNYNDDIKKRIDKSGMANQKFVENWTVEYFDTSFEYGFMLIPADMGSCEVKELAKMPDMEVSRNGKSVKVSEKTEIPEDESPIPLFCTLREWNRRIAVKARRLTGLQYILQDINKPHLVSCLVINHLIELLKTMNEYPFETDRSTEYYKSLVRLFRNDTFIKEFEATGKPVPKSNILKRNQIIKELEKHNEEVGQQQKRRRDLIDSLEELVEGIKEHMANPRKTKLTYYEDRQKIISTVVEEIDRCAGELLDFLRNDLFKAEFESHVIQQKGRKYDNDPNVVSIPIPSKYMGQEYYADFIYIVLNQAYSLLASTKYGLEVWEKEIDPALTALTSRDEIKELRDMLASEIEKINSQLKASMQSEDIKRVASLNDLASSVRNPEKPEATESKSVLAILYSEVRYFEGIIRLTIVNSPGPPCLLQLFFDVYEQYICVDIFKNPQRRGRHLRLAMIFIKWSRPMSNKATSLGVMLSIAKAFRNNATLRPATMNLNAFVLGDEVYGRGKVPPTRFTLLSSVALKSFLTFLSLLALYDKIEKCYQIIERGEWDEKSILKIFDDIALLLGTAGDASYTYVTSTFIMNNLLRGISPQMKSILGASRIKAISIIGTRLAIFTGFMFGYLAFSEASRLYNKGEKAEFLKEMALGFGNIMSSIGLILLTNKGKSLLRFMRITYRIPYVGWVCVLLGVGLLVFAAVFPSLHEKYLKEKIHVEFDRVWKRLENHHVFLFYSSPEWGADQKTINALDKFYNYRSKVDYTEVTWHAIIPLHNIGYELEAINGLVSNFWYLKNTNKGKSYCAEILDFYKMIKKEVVDNKRGQDKFGKKNLLTIYNELNLGAFVPEMNSKIYPAKYEFLADPFFSIPADPKGIGYIYIAGLKKGLGLPPKVETSSKIENIMHKLIN